MAAGNRIDESSVNTVASHPISFLQPAATVAVGSTLYYSTGDAATGRELWRDGSLVRDLRPGGAGSDPGRALRVALGSTPYFDADDGSKGRELWRTDGSRAGTKLVADRPRAASSRAWSSRETS